MKLNQQQQIESYLSGQMSPKDASLFEAQLEVNPSLQQELNFQSEVIRGVSAYRKAALKTRLEGLNVSSAWWSALQYTSLGQYIGGAVVVALIGGGMFWWNNQSENDSAKSDTLVYTSEMTSPEELTSHIPEIDYEKGNYEVSENEKKGDVSSTVQSGQEVAETPPIKKFNPKVQVPSAGNVDEEKGFNPEELPVPAETANSEADNKPVDVEVVESKSSKIKYRYYAGKLYLYGQFTSEPYEILEINSSKGRSIYLYHLKAYYQILPSDKPIGVQEITDAKLIQELSILRKAK